MAAPLGAPHPAGMVPLEEAAVEAAKVCDISQLSPFLHAPLLAKNGHCFCDLSGLSLLSACFLGSALALGFGPFPPLPPPFAGGADEDG